MHYGPVSLMCTHDLPNRMNFCSLVIPDEIVTKIMSLVIVYI